MTFFRRRKIRQTALGCVLCKLGYVTPEVLHDVEVPEGKRLGEALVEQGIITTAQLSKALDVQAKARGQGVDYAARLKDFAAEANRRTSGMVSALDELEGAAKRFAEQHAGTTQDLLHSKR